MNIIKILFGSILKWFGNKEPLFSPRQVDKIILKKKRKNGTLFEYKGEKKTLPQWARLYGIKYQTLHARMRVSNGDLIKSLECSFHSRSLGRPDIKTEALIFMYEEMKLSIPQIQERTDFCDVYKRLLKAGVKFRSRFSRVKSISEIEARGLLERKYIQTTAGGLLERKYHQTKGSI